MTTTTGPNPTHAFANAVRAALSDLPADEVDDLTDGLEADLAERAVDEESPDFGDPIDYANELRSAAGLPARRYVRATTLEGVMGAAWRDLVAGLRDIYAHPAVSRVGAFFVALRPLWWLVRAWAFFGILAWLFHVPSLQLTPLTFVLGVGSVIVSVQFGRGRWLPRPWMRRTLLGINIVLVLCTPIILFATTSVFGSEVQNAYAEGANDAAHDQDGLTANGRQVTNIFAYDADGKPLKQVQLYDQSGRPLYTVPDVAIPTTDSPFLVPYADKHGRGGWNVYPLQYVTANQLGDYGIPKHNATPTPSALHDLLVPPLESTSPKPTATAPPTPAPTSSATPLATPTPTGTPAP